jgi:transcriptional regulator with XRE-family HTH domain
MTVVKRTGPQSYWESLLKELRRVRNVSQVELARQLGVDQASVSRWERGLTEPHFELRRTLDGLARDLGLPVLDDVATVVRSSPFPMVLVDSQGRVIAASKCSGFQTDRTVEEQTPPEEREQTRAFKAALSREGFWEHRCPAFDYAVEVDGQVRRAVVTAIAIRGEVFALVQKAW